MTIEKNKVVTATYQMFVDGENGVEELMEEATMEQPLIYCHGQGMMLPKFEEYMQGLSIGDTFDFRIGFEDAYGEYDERGVLTLDKKMFYNGDGEFDKERVAVGNIIPMNTQDGQVVKAVVVKITEKKVTIDLNHPLAGENLHFVGKVTDMRDVTEGELAAIHHRGCGGGCHGNCHNQEGCDGNCHSCNAEEGESGCCGSCEKN